MKKTPVILLFLLIVSFSIYKIESNDIWFHLTTGKYILQSHTIPAKGIYTYTLNQDWINSEWLFQVILYIFYSFLGLSGIYLLRIGLTLAIYILIYWFVWQKTKDMLISVILIFCTILLSFFRIADRPEMISYLFVVVYLILLDRKKYLFIIPVLQVIWCNMHTLYFIGYIILVVYAFTQKDKKIFLIFALSLLAPLFSPHFINNYFYIFNFIKGTGIDIKPYITETTSLFKVNNFVAKFMIAMFFIYGACLAFNDHKIEKPLLIIYAVFSFFAFYMVRNIPFFAISGAFLVAVSLKDTQVFKGKELQVRDFVCGAIMILIFLIISNSFYRTDKLRRRFGVGILPVFPQKAIDYILKEDLKGNIFNNFDIGGYFVWRCFPDRKAFIVGNTDNPGFFKYYISITRGKIPYQEMVVKYNINYFLLSRLSGDTNYLIKTLQKDKGWKLAYYDKIAVVFERRKQ